MYERRRARILLAGLTLVSLVLVTVDARSTGGGPLARVRDGLAVVFGPAQDGIAMLLRPVTSAVDEVGELVQLRRDNERLREQNALLRRRERSAQDLERENSDLRGLLEMRDELLGRSDEYELLAAEVIALAPSNFEWTVTIDVGQRHGVEKDMTVVSGQGLVGRVVQVGPAASRVLLAVDRSFSAATRTARTGEQGYVEGGGTDPFRLHLLDPEADVREGDEVVTSSYRNATFPDGIPVGVIEHAGEASDLLSRDVLVRPYVDFTQLDHVLVILRQPPPEPFPSPSPTPSAPQPGVTPPAEDAGDGASPEPTPTP